MAIENVLSQTFDIFTDIDLVNHVPQSNDTDSQWAGEGNYHQYNSDLIPYAGKADNYDTFITLGRMNQIDRVIWSGSFYKDGDIDLRLIVRRRNRNHFLMLRFIDLGGVKQVQLCKDGITNVLASAPWIGSNGWHDFTITFSDSEITIADLQDQFEGGVTNNDYRNAASIGLSNGITTNLPKLNNFFVYLDMP